MNIPNRIVRNTIALTLIVLLSLGAIVYVYLKNQLYNSIDEQFQKVSESTEGLFYLNMEADKKVLDYKLDNIIRQDSLAKAVAKRDYKQIKSIVMPLYDELKMIKNSVNILTFRSPDGITLFRAHKPEYFGDMFNKERRLIVDTNTYERSFSGFEVGKFEMSYRVTKPIFYKNKYVGSVEVGMSPTDFLKDLNIIFEADMGIAVESSQLEMMLNKTISPMRNGCVLVRGSKKLKTHFGHKHVDKDELYKIDMRIPLQNHKYETLGYLVLGYDIYSLVEKDKEFMYHMFFMVVTVMLITAAVLHFGFDRILKFFTKQLYIDHLTGLKNRHALKDALFSKQRKVLFLSNIKEFSLLNEYYGVNAGNEILIQVAKVFAKFASQNQFRAYRVSSDEYVLIKQDNSFDDEKYNELIKKLHNEINSLKISIDGVDDEINVEIYSGIAYSDSHTMEDAQMALKKAKQQSLPYLMYSQHVDTKEYSQSVIKIKKTIKHALEHHNILPFFQPITDREGAVIKYEALIRIVEFNEGEKSILTPDSFLELSMHSGMYIELEKEMLQKSLAYFAGRNEKISVNFLPNDFFNQSIMDTFIDSIDSFDSPQRVVVEITEQEGVEDFDRLITVVEQLRELGVQIAIDDFGSGYANYAHILKIRPDYLKIDGSLVQNIITDEESRILVRSIINFAKELSITTIAEYVENEEIFELLKEYGVDEFQGYYFGPPEDLIKK